MEIRELNTELERHAEQGAPMELVQLMDSRRRILDAPTTPGSDPGNVDLLRECIECNRLCLPVLRERLETLRGRIENLVSQRSRLHAARSRLPSRKAGHIISGQG